jgi:hypothetical protein
MKNLFHSVRRLFLYLSNPLRNTQKDPARYLFGTKQAFLHNVGSIGNIVLHFYGNPL